MIKATTVEMVVQQHLGGGVDLGGGNRTINVADGSAANDLAISVPVINGGLTKTGNAHLRHILVEAAWLYQKRPGVSAALLRRRQGLDPQVVQIADRAQLRLYRKFSRMEQRGKATCKAAVAVGRELLGFMWAIATTRPHRATRASESRWP